VCGGGARGCGVVWCGGGGGRGGVALGVYIARQVSRRGRWLRGTDETSRGELKVRLVSAASGPGFACRGRWLVAR
jgi:hypothetical protein